jgi:hypothetical protein
MHAHKYGVEIAKISARQALVRSAMAINVTATTVAESIRTPRLGAAADALRNL